MSHNLSDITHVAVCIPCFVRSGELLRNGKTTLGSPPPEATGKRSNEEEFTDFHPYKEFTCGDSHYLLRELLPIASMTPKGITVLTMGHCALGHERTVFLPAHYVVVAEPRHLSARYAVPVNHISLYAKDGTDNVRKRRIQIVDTATNRRISNEAAFAILKAAQTAQRNLATGKMA